MIEDDAKNSLSPEYFEGVYNASDDPWNFTASEYEANKYAATIAALPKEKYDSAFEIGCSIGVLTAQLAERCQSLFAIDVNDKALNQARERCENFSNVRLAKMQIPHHFPDENFDLIIVSEVGYYLNAEDWKRAQEKIVSHLKSGGNVVLVHWTHFVADYPQTGNAVHDSFNDWSAGKLKILDSKRTNDYRLDVWEKL